MDLEKQINDAYQEIISSLPRQGHLRFGRRMVRVSDIAGQFYCEKALELSFLKPKPQTRKMAEGEKGHAAISSTVPPMTREKAVKEAVQPRKKPYCIYEFNIAWVANKVPIIGYVDETWFQEGIVNLVVERKFTNIFEIYPSYHIQAQLYCLGLGEMGFDITDTRYRIALMKRSCAGCADLSGIACPAVFSEDGTYQCPRGESKNMIYNFEKSPVVRDLDWALDYWLGRREAVPSKNIAKCAGCNYKTSCEYSQSG